jgi:hypothetical protein
MQDSWVDPSISCRKEWGIYYCSNDVYMSCACSVECDVCFDCFLKWDVTAQRYADGFLDRLGEVLNNLTFEPWFAEPLLLLLMNSNTVSPIFKRLEAIVFFSFMFRSIYVVTSYFTYWPLFSVLHLSWLFHGILIEDLVKILWLVLATGRLWDTTCFNECRWISLIS